MMQATLELRDLSATIAGARVLAGVQLSVAPGTFVGLIGRNGAGKTSLMRTIMGLLPAEAGDINLAGKNLRTAPPQARAALGIGYMPEDRRLIPDLSVKENVLVPAWATDAKDHRERLDFVYGILPEVREFASRRASQLSGGQQKLVALARALMSGRQLLLLDEPFEGVAPALAERLVQAIAALRATGVALLLSESDYVHSGGVVDGLYVIERGEVRMQAEGGVGSMSTRRQSRGAE
jgi:branched-chain amino acid transport system ATP-binding protein